MLGSTLRRYLSLLTLAVFASCAVVSLAATVGGPRHVAVGCDDFATQQQAQSFFHAHGGPWHDLHDLDPDRNAIACDQLP